MLTNQFKEDTLSMLGFGAMRLPTFDNGTINEKAVDEMVDYAIAHGVNYFDTAFPYHGGMSETVIGKSLSRYTRDKWFLATKYPGHQIATSYNPEETFELQLKKCGVEYFDYYLLHNVYDNSIDTYMDKRWNILPFFIEQKKAGRIRHLGFSTHGSLPMIKRFLEYADGSMEFCQIQLNYLDWTLQNAKDKYEYLTKNNIPVWVMEPIRGGKLAELSDAASARLNALRADCSNASWSLRFLQGLPNVKVILSGMSSIEQMVDNVRTFEDDMPLSDIEKNTLFEIAEDMKESVPCTSCRYCVDECPKGLDIPALIAAYNEARILPTVTVSMSLEHLPDDKMPDACIACGRCAKVCPQSINIPDCMKNLTEKLKTLPKWADICRERDEELSKLSLSD